MIRLIQFELAKLWHKKLFLLLSGAVVILLLLNFYQQCLEARDLYQKERYLAALAAYSSMPEDEQIPTISRELDFLSTISAGRLLATYGEEEEELELWFRDILAPYGMDYASVSKEFSSWSDEEVDATIPTLVTLQGQLEYVDNYRAFRDGFNSRAEKLLGVSVFSEDQAYSNRSIQKSMHDYDRLGAVEITLDYEEGIKVISGNSDAFYFLVILIFVACVMVFAEETEDSLRLLQATKRGRIPLAAAKWIATLLYTLLVTMLVCGGMLLIAARTLGFGDIGRSLQSISIFRNCWLPLQVKDYLVLFIALPMISLLFINATAAILTSLCRKVWFSAAAFLAFMGWSYYGYFFIHEQSHLNWIKYLNPIAIADVKSRFSVYTNIYLFGYPVSTLTTEMICCGVLFAAFAVGAVLLYCRRSRFTGIDLKKKRQHVLRGTASLFRHEWYRFVIPAMGVLGLAMIAGLGLYSIETEAPALADQDHYYYAYGQSIQGTITSDLEAWFDEQRLILQQEEATVTDPANSSGEAVIYTNHLEYKKAALEQVYQEYQQLMALKDQGVDVHYISSITTDPLVSRKALRNLLMKTVIYLLLLSVCVCPIFGEDQETNLDRLVRTTLRGRRIAFRKRYMVIFFVWLFTWICLMVPFLYNWMHWYPFDDWRAPVSSILSMSGYAGHLNVRVFLVVWGLNLFVSGFAFMVLLSTVSMAFKKRSTTWMVSGGLLLMDALCSLIPIPVCDWIALTSAIILPCLPWPVLNLGKNILICLGLLLYHRKQYTGELWRGE